MKRKIAAILAAAAAGTVLAASPAQAHVACDMDEHWMGHNGEYLVDRIYTYQSPRHGEVQIFAIKGGRTWWGSYPKLLRYEVRGNC